MSRWRPNKLNCLYVIPDIHGADDLLEMVLKRILPLRKSDGGKDKIIFLGDYIDRGKDGHKVIDRVISLKKKYKERVICLLGNHELLLLEGLGYIDCDTPDHSYDMWAKNGGLNTIVGYMERAGWYEPPFNLSKDRVKELIPKEHIDFMLNLEGSYEEDEFLFVHGGCDPDKPINEHSMSEIAWNRQLFSQVMSCISNKQKLPWDDKVIICGHSHKGPVIQKQYMMLDCGSPKKLLIVEARSRQAFMASPGKKRLVKTKLEDTARPRGAFRRSN